jgi:hydrogenase nickel incorporation protein HypB
VCGTCGCDAGAGRRTPDSGEPGRHAHDHHDGHAQADGDDGGRIVTLQEKVLGRNDALAAANRDWLRDRGVYALNLMSSPGAGKTTLLERTAAELTAQMVLSVIEGDQETALDAGRMRRAGCQVVQVNTGTGCHLDAGMVGRALTALDPPRGSVVAIENVGNLVCPALFDLGEAARVVLASVTEGADKPVKYPHMFRTADLVLVSKTDLLPYVDFDLTACTAAVARIAPAARVLPVSARDGYGLHQWYAWLQVLARGGKAPRNPRG